MQLKVLPGDFVVTEQADLRLTADGPWGVYRVRKAGCTTLDVQTRLASQLSLSRQQVVFPALKDKEAVAIQFATLPRRAPESIQGAGFEAHRVGYRQVPLQAGDLRGNAFSLVIRDLSTPQAEALRHALLALGEHGLPNYFDEQRFGSFAPGWGFIGKTILQRDAEQALYAYFARPFIGDPPVLRTFKRRAATLWPDWAALMAIAPRPSNYRSVLTYLQDHPDGYRKALNLIPQRLLSIYLAAYQSYLWNRIATTWLERIYQRLGGQCGAVEILKERYLFHAAIARSALEPILAQSLPLPNHHAVFHPVELEHIVEHLLHEKGLVLADMKARILIKAYLPHGQRPLFVTPLSMQADTATPDEHFPHRQAVRARFALPSGSYATLVCKIAMVRANQSIEEGIP